MNRLAGTDWFTGELSATIGDYLVGICVCARAGAGLENVERKMLVEFPFNHILRRLRDQG